MKSNYITALLLLAAPSLALTEQAEAQLEYESAFNGYKAYVEPEIQDWPAMIRQVEEIGGWRVYAREPHEKSTESPTRKPEDKPAHSHGHQHGGAQ